MSQHFIFIGHEMNDRLASLNNEIKKKQNALVLPGYTEFVTKLFKQDRTELDTLMHAAAGLAGEAGEVLDLAKKMRFNGKPLDAAKLIEELGDLRFYYQAMLNLFCLVDEEIQAYNINKLSRRYPGLEYSDAAANARADKQGSDGDASE